MLLKLKLNLVVRLPLLLFSCGILMTATAAHVIFTACPQHNIPLAAAVEAEAAITVIIAVTRPVLARGERSEQRRGEERRASLFNA